MGCASARASLSSDLRHEGDVSRTFSFDRNLSDFADRLDDLTAVVARAAAAIATVDPSTVAQRKKQDHSFVTTADESVEAAILAGLAELFPSLPVVSEEAAGSARPDLSGPSFALVDPLDGTREFLEGRPEYTVNLAIVRDGTASIGIVAAPALGLLWRGCQGIAERFRWDPSRPGALIERTSIRTKPPAGNTLRVIVSRSHLDAATDALIDRLPVADRVPCGSSLKFCRLAEGEADFYPRLAPTCEWDIAAGDALLTAAGGTVTGPDGKPVRYGGAARGYRVPAFLACADRAALRRILREVDGWPDAATPSRP